MALMLLLNAGIFISLSKIATGIEFVGKEKSNSSVSTLRRRDTDSSSVERDSPCEDGWLHKDNYCYRLENQQMNWERAVCHCLRKGGNLVSVHSQEQQEFLNHYFLKEASSRLWIGLHDTGSEGLYMWEDGSRFDYINWNTGEPSHTINAKEDCVEMCNDVAIIGAWNDVPCDIEHAFICQKRTQEKYSENEKNVINCCFVNVPTFIITIIFIMALLAQMGGMFYYRRLWLEKQHVKLSPVIFKSEVQDNDSSSEVGFKNDNAYEEPKYIHL